MQRASRQTLRRRERQSENSFWHSGHVVMGKANNKVMLHAEGKKLQDERVFVLV